MAIPKNWSRREVLKQSTMLTAAAALAPHAAAAAPAKPTRLLGGQVLKPSEVPFTDGDFYDNMYTRMGIRPMINCRGTITAVSGSTSLPEVKQAMYNASLYHVRLDEMMEAVGAEFGKLCGAEWGVATTGTAAATCLSTVACIAGTDVEKSQAMPYIKQKDQVLIPTHSRNPYDIGVRMCGVELVEFTTPEELRAKMCERSAMLYILANPRWDKTPMGTRNLAAIAHEKGIPVFVDAAATEPNNPNPHLQAGADLVAYSGGKCMRGPQSSGLLIGNKTLCKAAYFQGAPHHNYGRAMKISKEETMGLLAAVRAWHKRDHDAEQVMWTAWMQSIADRLKDIPGVTATVIPTPPPGSIDRNPGVHVEWDAKVVGITGTELSRKLDNASTRISMAGTGTRPDRMKSSVTVWAYILTPAEVKIIADAIHDGLTNPGSNPDPIVSADAPATVAGTWSGTIHYVRGTGEQTFLLKQDGNTLTGEQRGEVYDATFKGTIHGDQITLSSVLPVVGYPLPCNFKGTVSGKTMSGTVSLGEYGEVAWEATQS